jgi:hypothetical protein
MIPQPKPDDHRAVAVLTSYRALDQEPKSQTERVALLKHSQRSFVRTAQASCDAKPPEPQGPAACASLSSINNVKEQSPKPPTKIEAIQQAQTPPTLCAEVNKADHPKRGAALGDRYIGPGNRDCQAIGGEKRHGAARGAAPPRPEASQGGSTVPDTTGFTGQSGHLRTSR